MVLCLIVQELTRLGLEACPFDPCVFVLREDSVVPTDDKPRPTNLAPATGPIVGILGLHVDDGICGGGPKFQHVVQLLEQKYPFGSKKMTCFTFTSIEANQDPSYNTTLSQSNYIKKIYPIPIDINRNSQSELPVNDEERGLLRCLVGSLQYASTNTRPDLSNRLSSLQSQINSAQIQLYMKPTGYYVKPRDTAIQPLPSNPFLTMTFYSWCSQMRHLRPVLNPTHMPVASL